MPSRALQARWIALSLATGAWAPAAIADRLGRVAALDESTAARVAARLTFRFDAGIAPAWRALLGFVHDDPYLAVALNAGAVRGPLLDSPVMAPRPEGLALVSLPDLPTAGALAAWLELTDAELDWFADCRAQARRVSSTRLHHYRYSWIRKPSGGHRLLEKPKSRLKAIQRQVLRHILNRVPPHDRAHGFTRGRSVRGFAVPHVGRATVVRLDLRDFFHSVRPGRIHAVFRTLGYPSTVARLLQGLCCNSVSPSLAGERFTALAWRDRNRLSSPHLPQGAPTSGALANLGAFRLDGRLQGLAEQQGWTYTRYADDLVFSGGRDLAQRADFVEALVGAIATEEGFALNHRKTRVRTRAQRQRIAGVVVNRTVNVARADQDALKATLHNCLRHGPRSQNRDGHPDFQAHLAGRVAHVTWLNARRGAKLREMLERIDWAT